MVLVIDCPPKATFFGSNVLARILKTLDHGKSTAINRHNAPGTRNGGNVKPFRIATFNLEDVGGRAGRPTSRERLELLRERLSAIDADVLCIQEINSTKDPKTGERTLAVLDALLAESSYGGSARLWSAGASADRPLDVHNLAIVSRAPIRRHRQLWHDLMAPPVHRTVTADPAANEPVVIRWDRPVLHAEIETPRGSVHILNVHLKAPIAAPIAGQKVGATTWRSVAGWAEGFFVASLKRAGQALETRIAVDSIFEESPDALIAVCGDFNAVTYEVPVRILMGQEIDIETPALRRQALSPLERKVSADRRYSVIHDGRPIMLDHILVSQALAAKCIGVDIDNAMLPDEFRDADKALTGAGSFHAPLIADFDLGNR